MNTKSREFTDLEDLRLIYRGNKLLEDLYSKSVHSIRQLTGDASSAKAFYRFLQNDRVDEEDITWNMSLNCQAACKDKYVLCIEDTTEIGLKSHSGRIKRDSYIGTTNASKDKQRGLGFMVHPCLVIDAQEGIPYGYGDVKVWNRSSSLKTKEDRKYKSQPIELKESYRWIEVSQNTKGALKDKVKGMIFIQDREGDIYEQFAVVPEPGVDLLIRARANRVLKDKSKLFDCLATQPAQGSYKIQVESKKGRAKRWANLELRYAAVAISKGQLTGNALPESIPLYFIQAQEVGYSGKDKISWNLLTTLSVDSVAMAQTCIEWYSCRWMIEEVFKILKKEGYDIESSELEYASSIRKLCLMMLEVIIKLFLMRLAYSEPEVELSAATCFNEAEQEFLEHQITRLEGNTQKQKNPYQAKDLKRYVWAIARMGGWKGYESKKHPGITTLWIGLKYFKAAWQGWELKRNVSTR